MSNRTFRSRHSPLLRRSVSPQKSVSLYRSSCNVSQLRQSMTRSYFMEDNSEEVQGRLSNIYSSLRAATPTLDFRGIPSDESSLFSLTGHEFIKKKQKEHFRSLRKSIEVINPDYLVTETKARIRKSKTISETFDSEGYKKPIRGNSIYQKLNLFYKQNPRPMPSKSMNWQNSEETPPRQAVKIPHSMSPSNSSCVKNYSSAEELHTKYDSNKSILRNSFNENNPQDQVSHNSLKVTSHVKFVDRAQNAPLHTLHEVEKVNYESEDEERDKGSCTCYIF